MNSQNKKSMFGGMGFYIALTLCVMAVGVGGYFALFRNTSPTAAPPSAQGQPPSVQPEHQLPAPVPEVVVQTVEPVEIPVQMPDKPLPVDNTPVVAQAPQLIVKPLSGETVAAFSVTQLSYDETMEDWRTHDGMDIAATAGTNVLAACGGKVTAVYDDYLMGTTVVLDHDNGYQTVYSNLQAKALVTAGSKVKAGDVLGAVGTTSIAETAKGAHLHFAVTKAGASVDPEEFLGK